MTRLGKPIPADLPQVKINDCFLLIFIFVLKHEVVDDMIDVDPEDDIWEPAVKKFSKKQTKKKSDTKTPKEVIPKEKKKDKKCNQKSVPTENNIKTVESLLMKNGSKYLVKWKNYSDDENTWEHKTSLPKFVLKVNIYKVVFLLIFTFIFQFYEEDLTRLGSLAPTQKTEKM